MDRIKDEILIFHNHKIMAGLGLNLQTIAEMTAVGFTVSRVYRAQPLSDDYLQPDAILILITMADSSPDITADGIVLVVEDDPGLGPLSRMPCTRNIDYLESSR